MVVHRLAAPGPGNGWLFGMNTICPLTATTVHAGHEELRSLTRQGRGLAVEQRQLRGLHDVDAAVALGGLHEHVHLDVVQERQTQRRGRRCCPGVFG